MEKETYKTAKELLDKYDPDSEIVKVLDYNRFRKKIEIRTSQ